MSVFDRRPCHHTRNCPSKGDFSIVALLIFLAIFLFAVPLVLAFGIWMLCAVLKGWNKHPQPANDAVELSHRCLHPGDPDALHESYISGSTSPPPLCSEGSTTTVAGMDAGVRC